ncbi:MAG TPA: hypothetical protein VKK81_04180 [Candidatus Binatia bacterium]|nr:hypothetical protein [Candidatus Binatia bacterium]
MTAPSRFDVTFLFVDELTPITGRCYRGTTPHSVHILASSS